MSKVEPDDIEKEEGWLSPDGLWYSCECGDHSEIAVWLVGFKKSDNFSRHSAEDHLEQDGWIKVTAMSIFSFVTWESDRIKPTNQQMGTLLRWYKKHKVKKFDSIVNFKPGDWYQFEKDLEEDWDARSL